MTFEKLQVVNFGRTKSGATGSLGVGYTVFDSLGAVAIARTTTGVYELSTGSGNYAAYVTYPDSFHGSILWDTGTAFVTASYAAEQFNYEENNPAVDLTYQTVQTISSSVARLLDFNEGRWLIENNQMKFYAADNITLLAVFDLYDSLGAPTMDSVFERVKV